jgi:RHH-type proline utilization regulon transcriptional repressor/proline dehydrogenase/delta 1-pyrroline-5-carboxylate dehydrogenase
VPLIAKTSGSNAMIVDSTTLPVQVIDDVLRSAFLCVGRRCSALHLLFLQEDIADRVIAMMVGAMVELFVGNPDY